MNRSDYYSTREAAGAMMCSTLHVRRLIQERTLPTYQVGKRNFIPKAEVEAYIASKTIPAIQHQQGGDA